MGKRELIIDFLRERANESFTLEKICENVVANGKGKSTVYRIVSELVKKGMLRRLSDGKTRHCTYQFLGGEHCHKHLHLKCNECGKLIHLDDETSHELEIKLVTVGGFVIDEGALLYGKCNECNYMKGSREDE